MATIDYDSHPPSFVGVTRFSVFQPDSPKWKLTRKKHNPDKYRAQLWSSDRMKQRCHMFLEMAVPILHTMSLNHNYNHIVQYSDDMPDPWRSQLMDVAANYPFVHLHENTAGEPVRPVVERLLSSLDRPSHTVVQFRLDDDDLLSADYLDQLSAYATPADVGRAVSLANGYSALYADGGIHKPIREVRRLFYSHGLAYVGQFSAAEGRVSVDVEGAHDLVDRRMPTIVDTRRPAFFHIRHTGQDSLLNTEKALRKIESDLSKRPIVDNLDDVITLFPTLGSNLRE